MKFIDLQRYLIANESETNQKEKEYEDILNRLPKSIIDIEKKIRKKEVNELWEAGNKYFKSVRIEGKPILLPFPKPTSDSLNNFLNINSASDFFNSNNGLGIILIDSVSSILDSNYDKFKKAYNLPDFNEITKDDRDNFWWKYFGDYISQAVAAMDVFLKKNNLKTIKSINMDGDNDSLSVFFFPKLSIL